MSRNGCGGEKTEKKTHIRKCLLDNQYFPGGWQSRINICRVTGGAFFQTYMGSNGKLQFTCRLLKQNMRPSNKPLGKLEGISRVYHVGNDALFG